jgi:hypothetical protein
MRSSPGMWGRLVVAPLLALLAALPAAPVGAAASITFELFPQEAVAGQPASLLVQTWATGLDGEPNRSEPFDMTGYPFRVHAYRFAESPGSQAPADRGFPIELEQVGVYTWHARVTFPEPGPWVIVFLNTCPSLDGTPPPPGCETLAVPVLPATAGPPAPEPFPPPPAQVRLRAGGPLAPDCNADDVARLVTGFLDAFNRGDLPALAGFFPAEAARRGVSEPGKFNWFSVSGVAGVTAYSRDEVFPYVAERHSRHERLELLQLEVAESWHPGADIVFDVARRADDVPAHVAGGKGAVDCQNRTIFVWSMGDRAALRES